MNQTNESSGLYQELIARQLRSQIELLNGVLASIENARCDENDYVRESLKSVNVGINRLRKFVDEN